MATKPKADTTNEAPPKPERSALDRVQVTDGQIANWFEYHQPDAEQVEQFQRIRRAGAAFAQVILDNTPGSADQTAAIRKAREAVMTANAAIACRGR